MRPEIVTRLGMCAERHGEIVRIDGLDGTHMGLALVLLSARWNQEDDWAATVRRNVEDDEVLRSAVEMSLSLASNLGPNPAGPGGRSHAALALRIVAARFEGTGRPALGRFARDLAGAATSTTGALTGLTVHLVGAEAALDVCAALIAHTEVTRGVSAEAQFTAYRDAVARMAERAGTA